MSFSDETIKGKLSALNETQDSIVSVAQWIMFYRRYADRAAQIWLERLKESNSSKKLNLIYLANEIMQQAKSRKKEDFLNAFMPIIAEATSSAYKGATQEVQLKIRRVVEVWRDRQILDKGIQAATEARMDGMRSRHIIYTRHIALTLPQNLTSRNLQRAALVLVAHCSAPHPFQQNSNLLLSTMLRSPKLKPRHDQ